MSGLLGDILVGAATGGIRGQLYENQLEEKRLDEIAKQTRAESLARLQATLQGDNYAKQHDYRLDEIGQQNKFAVQRDETNYNRGLSDYIDKRTGHRYSRAEIAKFGGNLPAGIISVAKYSEKPAKVPDWQQKYNFLKSISPELANQFLGTMADSSRGGKGSGYLNRELRAAGLVMAPEKINKSLIDAHKEYAQILDPNKPPYKEWLKEELPTLASQAEILERLQGGGTKAGTGKFKSPEALQGATSDFFRAENPEMYLREAQTKLAPDQYSLLLQAVTKVISGQGGGGGGNNQASEAIHKKGKKSSSKPWYNKTTDLGEIMRALTNAGVDTTKLGLKGLNYVGNKLGESERALINLNNSVGQGLLNLGSYAKDRFKEAYVP